MRPRRGYTLIELMVVIGIIALLMTLLLPAIQKIRAAADQLQCANNLKQIGIALHAYHHHEGRFPPGYYSNGTSGGLLPPPPPAHIVDRPPPDPVVAPNGPGWGWAAYLLPHLEQDTLARTIDYTLPVEGPSAAEPRRRLLPIYTCPDDGGAGVFMVQSEFNHDLVEAATNSYVACFGAGGNLNLQPDTGNGGFFRNSRVRITDVKDGTSNTFAIGERPALFAKAPWAGVMTGGTTRTTPGAPVRVAIVELAPTMVLARVNNRSLDDPYSEPYDFWTPHARVANFLCFDGSVHPFDRGTPLTLLRALATRAGGEVFNTDDL